MFSSCWRHGVHEGMYNLYASRACMQCSFYSVVPFLYD
ncbi:hypothetical protein HMPREF9248_0958 [Fannyhessea vaginae PB189-T1-4]|uniref:Uncharacterized protein n=1 Tax=Fannyhessea vaginae PB189-T1-4 TaxID=866774 RepID=A0ABN0B0Q5_9ACTN|nr:hypothetical protein HMPREF9248_0958 [Fannyhessea vaginae PB189-T1-4]